MTTKQIIHKKAWYYLNNKYHDLLDRVRFNQGSDIIKINAFKKDSIELFRVTETEIWKGSGLGYDYYLTFEGRKEFLEEAQNNVECPPLIATWASHPQP